MTDFPQGPMPGNPTPWPVPGPPPSFAPPARPTRAPMFIAIAVALAALAALAVAIASWFRPAPEPHIQAAPTYTDAQVADAKKQVCDAFSTAHDAIGTAGNKKDPTHSVAYAVNARLAFFAGAQHLIETLSSQPAAPKELSSSVRQYATAYTTLSLALLADKTEDQIGAGVFSSGDQASENIQKICQ
jgi:hypothetical protein